MSRWWAPGSPGPMWGLASTNMFPSTQKDRANVLESKPRRPLDSPQQTPLPPSFKTLSISPDSPALPLLLLLLSSSYQSLSICRHLSQPRSYQDLFSHLPLFSPLSRPSLLLLPGAAVIFPHLRLIPRSGGMYGFICMVPAFYWIPIALEQRYHIPNSSRANLIQNSWSGHPSRCRLQCALCVLRVPPVCTGGHQ